jgi:hypothetical protein
MAPRRKVPGTLYGQTTTPTAESTFSSRGNCAKRSGSIPSLVLYPDHNWLRKDSIT